jgi:hypothetical protein
MPNDAKLGLIVGVGLVIGVAMVYFRKDLGPPEMPAEAASVSPVSSTRATPANPRGTYRSVKAKAVTQGEEEREGEGTTHATPGGLAVHDNGVRMIGPIDRPDRLP